MKDQIELWLKNNSYPKYYDDIDFKYYYKPEIVVQIIEDFVNYLKDKE